jgi:GMP synthase-like glutamine amidotransferase
MRAHYFQHVPFEGLGSMETWLHEAGHEISVTRWYAGERAPDPGKITLLIVLGGPMSVNDENIYPWLAAEKDFIRHWIAADRPLLGVCLGAQLIASSLGARVYPNAVKEIGWFPVTAVTPLPEHAFCFPSEQTVFHWHGETFDLPPGAIHLARSAGCEHQAFQVGRHVIGLQFHLETAPATAAALIANCRNELTPAPYIQDEATLQSAPPQAYRAINTLMDRLLLHITQGDTGCARAISSS